ncbi:MAG: shikimate dehydrogenase [Desulfococcaceae bacterium]
MVLNARTSLHCVFGDPVGHSLGPVMHNAAFRHAGVNGAYLAFRVTDIRAAVDAVRALGIRGVSVTIPHKVSVMDHLDEIAPMAREIGAVNTLVNRDGKLVGYNSDSLGAVAALSEKVNLAEKSVAVIGAGGAARAVGFGVRAEGAAVTVVNRSVDRGETLARDIGAEFRPLEDFDPAACQVLVNATPLGMSPNFDDTPISADALTPGTLIMDTVYNPRETRLLREAKQRGCVTIDGMAMFVYQGAFQFELWTGEKAPLPVMRAAVAAALGGGE